jgi:hypothetical protein
VFAMLPGGGLIGSASGTSPIYVNILSSADPAEVGISFELTGETYPSYLGLVYNWTNNWGGSSFASAWQLNLSRPGNLTVTLVVTDLIGDSGEAALTMAVRPHLSVSVSSEWPQVDAGISTPFFVNLSGGVGPFATQWVPSGGGPNGSIESPIEGTYSEQVTFWAPGPGWIVVRALDALGGYASDDREVAQVVPLGSIAFATNGSVGEVGWPVGIAVAVQAGTPPFQWSLSSSLPLFGNSDTFGTFPSDGMYRWNVSFAWAGTALLNLTVIDASGALQTVATSVVIDPPLAVALPTPSVAPGAPLGVVANLSGGLAPYSVELRLSDGENSNLTLATAGTAAASFDPLGPGNYTVEIRAVDALGRVVLSSETVRIAGPTPASPGPSPPVVGSDLPWLAGLGLLGVIGLFGGLYIYLRFGRRTPSPSTDAPSAMPAVRQLMRQSQIIDRETLVLLGEEAGESPEAVQRAIDALIRTGEVHTEPGPSHDEVLRWQGPSPPAPPHEGLP